MAETYEGLYVKFGANTVEFDNSVKGMNKALTGLKKDFQNINKQLKMNPENLDLMGKKLKNLEQQAGVGAKKTAELRKQMNELEKSNKKGTESWNKLGLELSKIEGQMQVVDNAIKVTKKQMKDIGDPKSVYNLNKALADTEKELDQINRKIKLEPRNTQLLAKQAKLLAEQFKIAGERVEALRKEQQLLGQSKIGTEQWKKLSYEIGEAEIKAKQAQNAMHGLGTNTKGASTEAAVMAGTFKGGAWLAVASEGLKKIGDMAKWVWEQLKQISKYLIDSLKEAADYGDRISRLSGKTGIDTGTLQRLNAVSKLTKVEVDGIAKSMQKMMINMEKAGTSTEKVAGSGKEAQKAAKGAAAAFKDLGLSARDSNGEFKNSNQMFWEVVQALSQIENKTQRTIYANAIFGKSYQNINGLLKMNREELGKALATADEMNAVLGDDSIKTLRNLSDEYKKFEIATDAFKINIGAALAPAAMQFMKHAVEIAKAVGDIVKAITEDGDVDGAIRTFEEKIGNAIGEFDKLKPAIEKTIEKLKPVLKKLVEEFAKVARDIIDVFFDSGLATAIADAGVQLAGEFVKALGRAILDGIKAWFKNIDLIQGIRMSMDADAIQRNKSVNGESSYYSEVQKSLGSLQNFSPQMEKAAGNTTNNSNSFTINIRGGNANANEIAREVERIIVRRVSF